MAKQVDFKAKIAVGLIFLLLTLYYSQFMYRTMPSQLGFGIRWNTVDNQLEIGSVHPELQDVLQSGDVVHAINGVEVTRRDVLPTPKTPEYVLELFRDGQLIEKTVAPLDGSSRIFTDLYASMMMWVIGAVITLVATRKSDVVPAVVFMLTGVGWLAIASFQLGEPTAWVLGYAIVPIMGPLYAQLGYSVQSDKNAKLMPTWLQIWLGIAALWGVVGGVEYLYLFPNRQSIHSLFNIEWLGISYLSVGIGLLLAVAIIVFRAIQLPPSYTKRQLVILVLFVAIGTLPFVFLTVLPRVFFGSGQLPGPVGFALLLLLPFGFLFVILRRENLYVEMATSRILTMVLLAVTAGICYSVIRLNSLHQGSTLPQGAFIFVVMIAALGIYPNSIFLNGVKVLLYGKSQISQGDLQSVARQVTRQPSWNTVGQALNKVCESLELENVILYEWEEQVYKRVASGYPPIEPITVPDEIRLTDLLPKKIVHTSKIGELEGFFTDKAVYIPIVTADLLTGFLVALPRQTLGQLHERDLTQLRQIGDTLAIGFPAIKLFERISDEQAISMYSREVERQKLAAKIHDGPLQDLLILGRKLNQREQVNHIAQSLRRICHSLYNPILDEQIEHIAEDVIDEFRWSDFEIHLMIRPNVSHVDVENKVKLAFYYILKEAISNVTKHTSAKNIEVELLVDGVDLKVRITDDGESQRSDEIPQREEGNHQGLSDMRYWASVAGGKLAVNDSPSGWTVYLDLPISTHSHQLVLEAA